jgi:tetratricopeptide (TPR) repeat protein
MAESFSLAPAGFGAIERRATLVGRTAELATLEAALRAVRDNGKTRAITIFGAAGIGKTRLVRDFLSRARAQARSASLTPLRVFRGSAREGGGVYDVFARVLRKRFDIHEGMATYEAMGRVRQQVAEVLEDRKVGDVCYFLGHFLELEFMDSPLIQAVRGDPTQMRALRSAVIKRFLEADAARFPVERDTHPDLDEAARHTSHEDTTRTADGDGDEPGGGPVVLVFDDLHHASDESLDLLIHLTETLEAPILVICLARPELVARRDDWKKTRGKTTLADGRSAARHDVIELAPLAEADASRVMGELLRPCADALGTGELVDAACMLAGGNPALLERMVHIFHDMGVLEAQAVSSRPHEDVRFPGWLVHVDRLSEVKLPLTVEDAIQARIAALAPHERELLERAAMMGSVFWLGGLVAMARLDTNGPDVWSRGSVTDIAKLKDTLRELKERDYVLTLPDGTFADDEEYVFKHNLERETLLKLLPRAHAMRFHKAIADWLSFKPHVRTHEEYMGMLARHQEEAGLVVQAAATYLDAAHLAREHYSNAKASEYYVKGLTLLRDGAEGSTEQQLRALHHYGDVLQLLGRSDEALDCYSEMLARAYRLNLRSRGGTAHSRIGRLFRDTGRLDDGQVHLECALTLFEDSGDDRGVASAMDDIGKLCWLRGNYEQALSHTQRALTLRRKLGDRRSISLSLNNLGLVYQDSGQFMLALDSFEQALRIRREIGDFVGVSISLNNLASVAQDQRDDARARQLYLEAFEVAKETGDPNRIALILTNLGDTYNRLGEPAKALHYLKQAYDIAEELGDQVALAEVARGLGKSYLLQRDYKLAQEQTGRAVEILRTTQNKVQLGVALRALGEVLAVGTEGPDGLLAARAQLLQSIWIFEEIGNDIELARSCRVYAALLRASPDFATDETSAREAAQFAERAESIFQKLRASAKGIDTAGIVGT